MHNMFVKNKNKQNGGKEIEKCCCFFLPVILLKNNNVSQRKTIIQYKYSNGTKTFENGDMNTWEQHSKFITNHFLGEIHSHGH